MNPCSAEFRSFAGYQIIDYAQPCDPRVHVLLPSLEKSVGEMTVPFRKSLVPFIFSSPPETHPTFHVFQCGAPLEMITCASHLRGDWGYILALGQIPWLIPRGASGRGNKGRA